MINNITLLIVGSLLSFAPLSFTTNKIIIRPHSIQQERSDISEYQTNEENQDRSDEPKELSEEDQVNLMEQMGIPVEKNFN